jgi:hypothetical protein
MFSRASSRTTAHDATAHAEDVLLELHAIRQFNAGHRDVDMRAVIDQPLTMNDPAGARGEAIVGHVATLPGTSYRGVGVAAQRRAALMVVRDAAEKRAERHRAELMRRLDPFQGRNYRLLRQFPRRETRVTPEAITRCSGLVSWGY